MAMGYRAVAVMAAVLLTGGARVTSAEPAAAERGALESVDLRAAAAVGESVSLVRVPEPGGFLLSQVATAGGSVGLVGEGGTASAGETVAAGPSPGRALLLSGILPGAGEFYAGSKKRAALFFGLEAAALTLYFSWDAKGNDLEDDFRAVADEEWDPWDYLNWRTSTISRYSSITHALPCSAYVAAAPTSASIPEALRGCSGAETQQYYELIGKYDQYVSGWSDLTDRDGNPVHPTEVDSAENYLSDLRLSYEDDRNDSNKYLKRASNISGFILVNHVLSAIDAARVARARASGASEAAIERRTRVALVMRGDPAYGLAMPMVMAYRPIF